MVVWLRSVVLWFYWFTRFRKVCCIGVSGLVAAEVDGGPFTVSCECCGRCSGVIGRVVEKTWGETTPESFLVTESRLHEMSIGAVGKAVIGKEMESSANGSMKLLTFPILCSKNRSQKLSCRWSCGTYSSIIAVSDSSFGYKSTKWLRCTVFTTHVSLSSCIW